MDFPRRLTFTLTAALSTLPVAAAQSYANAPAAVTAPYPLAQIEMFTPEARLNPGIVSGIGAAKPQPVQTCFLLREYHFSRESKTADTLKLDGSSTCQTAKAFQLKNAEAQGAVLQR